MSMKKIVVSSMIVATSLFAQVQGDIAVPYIDYEMKPGKGADATSANCLMCHSFGYVLNQGKQSKQFWEHKVEKMIVHFGAPITKEDAKVISEYLYENYGNGKKK